MKGIFKPKHPEKYMGDPTTIAIRSSWEYKVLIWLDSTKRVIRYGSEELKIPYISPIDSMVHQYIPDFIIEYVDRDGVIHQEILEVKPLHEADEKHAKSERSKNALLVNQAKFRAATEYCTLHGLHFRVLTEKSIFIQKKKNDNL